VRCPVSPGQILQAGANYRKHVVDIVMAERRADLSLTDMGVTDPVERAAAAALPAADLTAILSGNAATFLGLAAG
jgi:hypothetical protein